MLYIFAILAGERRLERRMDRKDVQRVLEARGDI